MIGSFIPSGIPTAAAFATTDWSRFPSDLQRLPGVEAQKGDIIIYACNSGGAGHVAVYESDNVTYHQNYNDKIVERIDDTYYKNARKSCCYYWGVIRPDFKQEITPVDLGTDFSAAMVFDYATTGNASVVGVSGNTKGSNVELSRENGLCTPSQLWNFERQSDGSYYIKNAESGLYLDVDNEAKTNGTNIKLWEWSNSTAQKWYIVALNDGGYRFIPKHCYDADVKIALDIYDGAAAAGTNVQLWGYTGNASDLNGFAQRIYIQKMLVGTPEDLGTNFKATITFNGLAISEAGTTKGSNVELSEKNGEWKESQIWEFIRNTEDKTYYIRNVESGLYLDVYNSEITNGTNIQLWESNNNANQRWYIIEVEGKYRLIPKHCYCEGIKKALDINGGATAAGTNVQLWGFTGEVNNSSWNAQMLDIEKYTSYQLGDVNADGVINARDAKLVLQHFTEKITLTEEEQLRANVNKDSVINARDAKLILQLFTEKITEF